MLTAFLEQKNIAGWLVHPIEPMHAFEKKCGGQKSFCQQILFAQVCTLTHIHVGRLIAFLHCVQVLHV